jgi:hypothetical protein
MTRWDYTTLQMVASGFENASETETYQNIINQYGAEGWELVGVTQFAGRIIAGDIVVLFFKRPSLV